MPEMLGRVMVVCAAVVAAAGCVSQQIARDADAPPPMDATQVSAPPVQRVRKSTLIKIAVQSHTQLSVQEHTTSMQQFVDAVDATALHDEKPLNTIQIVAPYRHSAQVAQISRQLREAGYTSIHLAWESEPGAIELVKRSARRRRVATATPDAEPEAASRPADTTADKRSTSAPAVLNPPKTTVTGAQADSSAPPPRSPEPTREHEPITAGNDGAPTVVREGDHDDADNPPSTKTPGSDMSPPTPASLFAGPSEAEPYDAAKLLEDHLETSKRQLHNAEIWLDRYSMNSPDRQRALEIRDKLRNTLKIAGRHLRRLEYEPTQIVPDYRVKSTAPRDLTRIKYELFLADKLLESRRDYLGVNNSRTLDSQGREIVNTIYSKAARELRHMNRYRERLLLVRALMLEAGVHDTAPPPLRDLDDVRIDQTAAINRAAQLRRLTHDMKGINVLKPNDKRINMEMLGRIRDREYVECKLMVLETEFEHIRQSKAHQLLEAQIEKQRAESSVSP